MNIYQGSYRKSFYCKIKELLTQIQYIYDELKDGNEMGVLEKYNYNARRYTVTHTSKTIISIFYHIYIYILYISMLIYFPNLYIIKYIFNIYLNFLVYMAMCNIYVSASVDNIS